MTSFSDGQEDGVIHGEQKPNVPRQMQLQTSGGDISGGDINDGDINDEQKLFKGDNNLSVIKGDHESSKNSMEQELFLVKVISINEEQGIMVLENDDEKRFLYLPQKIPASIQEGDIIRIWGHRYDIFKDRISIEKAFEGHTLIRGSIAKPFPGSRHDPTGVIRRLKGGSGISPPLRRGARRGKP
ncbi:MAG: hypothetical protein HQK66_07760 [Desulfamplus sp.]|nr:hypothetical protein [Desulfamplus sp.]